MSDMLWLAYTTIMVSTSGALSPGPLTIATLTLGSKYGWRGGIMVAIGHALVELSYIFLLYLFITSIRTALKGMIGNVITLLGTFVILFFALGTIRDGVKNLKAKQVLDINIDVDSNRGFVLKHPIIVGMLFTGLNIWFLLWWLSIGFSLISAVYETGIIAVLIMFLSHIWIDFLWLGLIAETGKKGSSLVGSKGYGVIIISLGILLAVFGIDISLKRFLSLSILP